MTDEKLEFANILKKKINQLDSEIGLLMDLFPPVRSAGGMSKGTRGWIQKIRGRILIWKKPSLAEREIELSNEDIRALIDIRTAELEALKQVLNELG